jgi:hypothetical protein
VPGSVIRTKTEKAKVNIVCVAGGKEVGGAKLVGSYAPSSHRGTSASHPSFLEFDAGSGSLEVEGSGGTVQSQTEGELRFLGYEEQELINSN